MMPFLLAEFAAMEQRLPLYVCIVGSHEQQRIDRPLGYPCHQLFLSRSGSGTVRLEGSPAFSMTPGTVLLLPAGIPHEYFPSDGTEGWDLGFIGFDGPAARAILEPLSPFSRTPFAAVDFPGLWRQLEAVWHGISQNGEQAYWESSQQLYGLLLSVMKDRTAVRSPKKKIYPQEAASDALRTAVRFIHDHYQDRLVVSNIARAAGYSPQHFHRLFVRHYGVSPNQYLLQLRMRRSIQLFREQPGITVEQTAQRLGMETSYFIRLFKRFYGKTPKQYLKSE
ncbi:AraC family transcriptional regulator [Cohnella thailandensis]|uniref:Helix-turn-helix transcriptional regulator n=1 Tax=Cohnella thailandensis TaxID=557557 RepID=A0A841SW40_9BACL|nr:AraC family transcriptional regulator [Cohnella thailandensis]MBB6634315.1 helix-turn-helix transcriptional regulator [Cohnella thailandensis]MBP1972186.1 AraC-like DNA-binding protein [Cohnella thailandensis]